MARGWCERESEYVSQRSIPSISIYWLASTFDPGLHNLSCEAKVALTSLFLRFNLFNILPICTYSPTATVTVPRWSAHVVWLGVAAALVWFF
jgi:hypothetical protein